MANDAAARTRAKHAPNKNANGAKPQPQLKLLTKALFMSTFTAPDYLIADILMRGFVYALTGPTAHAKSAIALLIAELVSSTNRNAMFGAHKVEKGRVLYFVGENPLDIRMRVIGADSRRFDDPENDEIFFIDGQVDFDALFDEIASKIEAIGGVALIIVDTSAAYFLGEDENSNPQMGNHARKLRRLTTLPGNPCVLVLCHPIKNAQEPSQLLPRGGGAFLAEMDGNLTAWKTDELVQLNYTKMRGPGFEPITLKLERIETTRLQDSKGRILPTVRAVVVNEIEVESSEGKLRQDHDLVLLRAVTYPRQSLADIAKALGWINDKGEPAKMRVKRALDRLVKAKMISDTLDGLEATDKGKRRAGEVQGRISALAFAQQGERLL
jgi:hypothetical protein